MAARENMPFATTAPSDAAGDLCGYVSERIAPADALERCIDERHDGVEMPARHGPEHQDDRKQPGCRGRRVLEQLKPDVAWREGLRRDPRADHQCAQERRAEELGKAGGAVATVWRALVMPPGMSLSANSPGSPACGPRAATCIGVVGDALDRHLDGAATGSSTAKAPRGSPSLGLPTEPQLTNSTPPYSWTQGLWVWPNTSTLASLGRRQALIQPRRLVLEEVLVDFAGGPVNEVYRHAVDVEAQVERQFQHESLESWLVCSSVQATDCWPSSRSCGVT